MRKVLAIGVLSGVLYGVVYFSQRGIFLNGLSIFHAGLLVEGDPADGRRLLLQCAGYYGATIALFGLYLRLLSLCRRGQLSDRGTHFVALAFPVLFNIVFLFGRPYLSIDLFSYLGHGYLGNWHDSNPYLVPVRNVEHTLFGPRLVEYGWRPGHGVSPYGPLWTHIEVAIIQLTADVSTAMLLIKAVVVLASLSSAALIWLILGRVRPDLQLLATLMYLWNPMVIVEFAAEGHNDALMIVFVLAAILLLLHDRLASSIVALTFGALTKYIPLVLLPAHVIYAWRTRQSWRRLLLAATSAIMLSGVAIIVLFAPFWAGTATLEGVQAHSRPRFLASASMVLLHVLSGFYSEATATQLTSLILLSVLGLCVVYASLPIRNADRLLDVCAGIALVYMLVASPGYWPWYATLPFALLALSPHPLFFWMALLISFCSRLVAPLDHMQANGFGSWELEVWITTVVCVLLPLAVLLVLGLWQWWKGAGWDERQETRSLTD